MNGHDLEKVPERYVLSDTEGFYYRCRKCCAVAYTETWFRQHPCEQRLAPLFHVRKGGA